LNLSEVAAVVSGRVLDGDGVEIRGVSDISGAGEGDLTFAMTEGHARAAAATPAAAVLVPEGVSVPGKPVVVVRNPKYAFVKILGMLGPREPEERGVHPAAFVAEGAAVGTDAFVGPGAVLESGARIGPGARILAGACVGRDVSVGEGATVGRNAVLYPDTVLGARSVVHAGAVLGADGFGYLQEGKDPGEAAADASRRYLQVEGPHLKVPHYGRLEVGEDVEIGAGTTIDRSTTGSTFIGDGTKIDNLVQIGHNCRIGRHVIIVSMVGIGGSVTVGDHVTIGGNCGISESVVLGDFCIVGAHTLAYPGRRFAPHTVVWGNPARPAKKFRAQLAAISSLPRIVQKVKDLEGRLRALEGGATREEGGRGA
jgi:UDP-3-O-[3-hydroxymyristoyl] glucosamine N-acyltransferase